MVESLKELNQICQKPRYKEVGNWMVRHILRDAALPITRLLLYTSITANQVTLISLFVALAGILCFSILSNVSFLLGAILLQAWYLLDHVDGQIARYRKTDCMTGRFFDYVTHHLIHGVIYFSLGLYCYRRGTNLFFIVWGFTISVAAIFFNISQDIKFKTFYEYLVKSKQVEIKTETGSTGNQKPSLIKSLFSFLHKIFEIHVMMNILTLCAIIQFWTPDFDFRFFLFGIYGLIVPFLAVTKISHMITSRAVDVEFKRLFKTS